MILVSGDHLLGDSLCTSNIVQYFAIQENEAGRKLNLVFVNDKVYELIPNKNYINRVTNAYEFAHIPDLSNQTITVLDVGKALQKTGGSIHMTQSHFDALGIALPHNPAPVIEFEQADVPTYDYIISPYSQSDYLNNKLWPYHNWQEVINRLHPYSVCVVGTDRDPKLFTGVSYFFDRPLGEVASLLKNVQKQVLTIDNGIAHLTHAVGVNHGMLYPQCLNDKWVLNPQSKWIRGAPLGISVNHFMSIVTV